MRGISAWFCLQINTMALWNHLQDIAECFNILQLQFCPTCWSPKVVDQFATCWPPRIADASALSTKLHHCTAALPGASHRLLQNDQKPIKNWTQNIITRPPVARPNIYSGYWKRRQDKRKPNFAPILQTFNVQRLWLDGMAIWPVRQDLHWSVVCHWIPSMPSRSDWCPKSCFPFKTNSPCPYLSFTLQWDRSKF